MKYERFIYLFLGLVLLVSTYLAVSVTIFKFITFILALVFFYITIKQSSRYYTVLSFIGVVMLCMLFDYIVVYSFNVRPVFSIKTQVGENAYIYSGLSYNLWDCNGVHYLTSNKSDSYLCSNIGLTNLDSNVLVHELVKDFDAYKNKFVKIDGKVSRIISNNQIELNTYVFTDESINGYVVFSEDLIYRFNFNDQDSLLDKYYAYDFITIIGQITDIIYEDNQTIININNSKIVESELYDDFELVVTEEDKCEDDSNNTLISSYEDVYIYNYCLNSVLVKYSDQIVYDLSYLLQLKKVTIEEVLSKKIEQTNENDNVLYEYENFNIIKCSEVDKEVFIIGSDSLELDEKVCTIELL